MISRKNFLKKASLLSTVLLVNPGCMTKSSSKELDNAQKVGIQLYSLREQISDNVTKVIGKVAQAGFSEVETYGYSLESGFWGLTPLEFNSLLNENGLVSPSGHYDLGAALSKGVSQSDAKRLLDECAEAALAIGQKVIVVPWLSEDIRQSKDDYKLVAEKLNLAGEELMKSGLSIGYHNHAFEFDVFEGETGYDVLLAETEADKVEMELDLYWVVRSGVDPLDLFEKHPGRFSLWHVKDMDKVNQDLNTEIGNGSIDFSVIFEKATLAGLKHAFLEQENFAIDPYKSILTSIDYIKQSLLK